MAAATTAVCAAAGKAAIAVCVANAPNPAAAIAAVGVAVGAGVFVGAGAFVAVGAGAFVGVAVGVLVAVAVGVLVAVAVGVLVAVAVGVLVAVAVGVAVAAQLSTVMVSDDVETVPPNAKARPFHVTVLPIVIPAASITVPWNAELAPSVVAAPGVQKTAQDDVPRPNLTAELATVVRAPVIRKMYVPLLLRVIPPVPTEAAPVMQ